MTSLQYTTSGSLTVNGIGNIPSLRLDPAVGILRGVYYSSIGGVRVSAQVPIGGFPEARIDGVDQSSSEGFSDLTLGFTACLVHTQDKEYGRTIGMTAFVTAPTGNYDVKGISLGSGTWTFTPQIGLIQALGNGFFLDAALDVAFQKGHKENGSARFRDPSTELQAYLRYQTSDKISVYFG